MDPWIIAGLTIATLALAGLCFATIEAYTSARDRYEDDGGEW